jgi:hypothetical protein
MSLTGVLAFLFFLSALMNFGYKIPLGFASLSFIYPSSSIAEYEIVIALVLISAAVVANLYLYGGAYLFAVVGIAEGLFSADVQGLARYIHETMIPFVVAGWILIVIEARSEYKARGYQTSSARRREIVTVLQFFVGGLVTLGGAAFTSGGTYPIGTALGAVHLGVGLTGLYAGYVFFKRKNWSQKFLVAVNAVTIVWSTLAESLAEIYAYLPRGINDALIGTIIAIIVSGVIILLLPSMGKTAIESVVRSSRTGKNVWNPLD